MRTARPEPGAEYASWPSGEYRAASRAEAARSLARHLGATETRALALLRDPPALAAELRSCLTGPAVLRLLERRYAPPSAP